MYILSAHTKKNAAAVENRELSALILLEIALDEERGKPMLLERVDEIELVRKSECGVLYKTCMKILVSLGVYNEHGEFRNNLARAFARRQGKESD